MDWKPASWRLQWQAVKLLKPIQMADKERGECEEGNEKRSSKKRKNNNNSDEITLLVKAEWEDDPEQDEEK